jgi:antitoxin YefM
MTTTLSIVEARERLTRLPEQLDQEQGAIVVTRRGKPVLAILPWDLYESIMETLEILGDEEQMAALREGIAALERGETVPWEDMKAEFGL